MNAVAESPLLSPSSPTSRWSSSLHRRTAFGRSSRVYRWHHRQPV